MNYPCWSCGEHPIDCHCEKKQQYLAESRRSIRREKS